MSWPASSAFASCGSTVSSYPIRPSTSGSPAARRLRPCWRGSRPSRAATSSRCCEALQGLQDGSCARSVRRARARSRRPGARPWALRLGRRRLPAPPFLALGCGAWISREYGERVKLTASWRRRSPIRRFRMPTGLKCASRTTGDRRPSSRLPTARSCTAARFSRSRSRARTPALVDVRRHLLLRRRLARRRLPRRHRGLLRAPLVRSHRRAVGPRRPRPRTRGRVPAATRPHRQAHGHRRLRALGRGRPVVQPRRAVATDAHHRDRPRAHRRVCGSSAPKRSERGRLACERHARRRRRAARRASACGDRRRTAAAPCSR